jgi:Fic family protein
MASQPSSKRAGRYVRQSTGYSAFIPCGLPPNPTIQIDDELLTLLSKADRAIGRLDGSTEILPNPDLFVVMYVRKEAVLSSQIEGTQASLMEVLEFEEASTDVANPEDAQEVVNYVDAMNFGLERLKKLPLSLRLIREIHGKLMRGVRGAERTPGEFRRSQNWIGSPGCTLATAAFIPPPPHEMEVSLGNLVKFFHSDDPPIPYLIKAGLAHGQFETIHPFLDGNGRAGRLLITFMLCERKVLQRPLLYLSHYFKKHRTRYYDLLQAVRVDGDWEGWLKFFLRGVYEVAQEATFTARQIVVLREEHRTKIACEFRRTANAWKLLESLYHKPIVSVNGACAVTGLAFANANTLIQQFVKVGLLDEVTGSTRNRRFSYTPYLRLFDER